MSKPTSVLLLLIVLAALSFHGGQSRSLTLNNIDIHEVGDENERPTEKKKEEAAVVVLTQNNFTEFVNQNKYVMVNFYAPWCYWSRRLAPEYEAAAPMVAGEAVLAKVDASTENRLSYRYKVNGYPTVIFFVGGVRKEDYYSERTRGEIAKWVQKKVEEYGPRATITTEKEVEPVLVTASA
ncbi:hypothetical protein K2173_011705 [Erythroxylum novogranatense]|uniref:Thioredoxin domain-containing protein n=1 Tax=Erythroxylum novogranatense TaxID=1862640 RepID=A0AAV8T1Z4_9ROSI|nr:hypothetical protein K2173_011705 [Erythroxylum novogranatense]